MRSHPQRFGRICVWLLAAWLGASGPPAARAGEGDAQAGGPDADAVGAPPGTRHTMDQIFRSISFVLPLSLSDERFQDPAKRQQILAALDALARNGSRLADHGRSQDASFRFLSRSLARDTQEIRDRFADGRVAEARYLLHQVTEDCVACHSRLPSDRKFPLGERFVSEESIATLPPEDRATLEMATRQFDRALATLEALFASREVEPGTLDLRGHFDDYLEVCIRVKGDLDRPIGVLQTFLTRDDLSPSLRANVTSWVESLRSLQKREPMASPLAEARALIARAESRARYPNDRRALVDYIAASSVLHKSLAAEGERDPRAGEAYYLLGLIESRIGRSFWLSQTEFFLETAIRLDPSQPQAVQAYELLEEFMISGYTGSSGVHVPEDVQQRLDELKQLINRS